MAVKNFPAISPDANPSFTLESNTSSFESTLNKNVQHMELPGARWRGSVAFSNRTRQEANKIKAFMASLGGQIGRFYLTPFDAYQSGTMSGAGVVDGAVSFGASTIPTKGWEGDQDELFKAGDYIEVGGELKMVPEDVAAPQSYIEYTGTNYMPSPFDPSGWSGASDPDLSYASVSESNPSGEGFVGEFEYVGPSFGTMIALTSVDGNSGDNFYFSAITKKKNGTDVGVRIRIQDGAPLLLDFYVSLSTGSYNIDSGSGNVRVTKIGFDYWLIEAVTEINSDSSDIRNYFQMYKVDNSGFENGLPTVGDSIQCQAAYFGKADDWPAQLLATADIPIAPPLRKSLTGGESITVTKPKGKFYLGSNDQSWDINVNGVQSMGFDFIEDVN